MTASIYTICFASTILAKVNFSSCAEDLSHALEPVGPCVLWRTPSSHARSMAGQSSSRGPASDDAPEMLEKIRDFRRGGRIRSPKHCRRFRWLAFASGCKSGGKLWA